MPATAPLPMRRRYRIGVSGLLFLAFVTMVGVAAGSRAGNLLVWVFSAMVAWILVSGIVSGAMLMGVRVRRLEPGPGAVGRPLVVRYEVSNASHVWPLADLRIGELDVPARDAAQSHAWVVRCGARQRIHAEAILWPTRRGRLRLAASVASSSFPFGLMQKSVQTLQPREVLVHPLTVRLKPIGFARLVRTGRGQGQRVADGGAGGEDFRGLRGYVAGDPLRHVAWKRSTALESPVVVERSTPAPRRLLVVLDLSHATQEVASGIPAGEDARQREEDAITLAASVLVHAEREGWEVSLRIAGLPPDARALVASSAFRRGAWHLDRLLGSLAAVDLDAARQPLRAREDAPGSPVEADASRSAVTIAVHPGRVDLAVGGAHALHLTASALKELAAA